MHLRLVTLLLALGTALCSAQLRVGVGKRVVTPDPLLPVSGGIGPGKAAAQKRGDLHARAIVLEQGEVRVAFVALDFLGFPAVLGDRIRRGVSEIPADNILIGASHTHSAPDCYGFPDETGEPGCDLAYLARVCTLAAEAVREAWAKREPARLKIATGEARGKIAFNYYAEQLYDPRCSVIQAIGEGGDVLGTLVNYAIHPEVLGSEQGIVSPDLVGPLCERIEAEAGGMALFLNGALGGMVTADVRGPDGTHRRTWAECQRIGDLLGREALRIVAPAPVQGSPELRCHTRRVRFPVESRELREVIRLSPLRHPVAEDGSVLTQVNLIELGNARILTIPGEALPNIGYYLKRKLGAEHQLLFGLTNDAFGYILTKVDWNSFSRYDYITRTCLGEMTGEIYMEEALAMVRALEHHPASRLSTAISLLEDPSGPWLGLGLQELDILEAALEATGVRVVDVAPGGPADEAGVRRGDVVTHWNGQAVGGSAEALQARIGQMAVKERVDLTLHRGGRVRRVQVEAADRGTYDWPGWRPGLPDFRGGEGLNSLFEESAAELDALKRQFGLEDLVEPVEPTGESKDGKKRDPE